MKETNTISENSQISLNFSLLLEDGAIIDSNFEKQPLAMTLGDGNMLPSFEQHLLGRSAGEAFEVKITANEAFGPYNEDNVQRFKASQFDKDLALEPGLVISFADPAGGELPGVVKDFKDEYVEVDFNHPLAGRDIIFKVAIHSIDS